MANKKRKHFLPLSRPQLIALAVQKGVLPYSETLAHTKEQLIALLIDVEGVLKPVRTWAETPGTEPGTIEESPAVVD